MSAREYALGRLEEIAAELSNMEVGGRNDALNKAAFELGGLVQPDALEEREVREAVESAALSAGLLLDEIRATLAGLWPLTGGAACRSPCRATVK